MNRPEAILIAGPTASGKSALAVRLATRLGGRVVNADSVQVYRDLRILSARPGDDEMGGVPHALYGTIDAAQNHSVSLWVADATRELQAARDAGQITIFAGGTGLYFKALTQGLSAIPQVPEAVRAEMRAWAAGRAPEALHAELTRRDPQTAQRLRPSDPQRLIRALEVHAATGRGLSDFHASREPPTLATGTWRGICLDIDRAVLRARVDERLETMVARGAIEEVAALDQRQLDRGLPIMRAIGVPQFLGHVNGELSLDSALAAAKAASRQYIKRQDTFVRHQLPDFRRVAPDEAEAVLMDAAQSS